MQQKAIPKENQFIYLVRYSSGCWDNHYKVNIFVTYEEEKAKAYVEKFNTKLAKWKKYWTSLVNEDDFWEDNSIDFHRYSTVTETNEAFYTKIEIR